MTSVVRRMQRVLGKHQGFIGRTTALLALIPWFGKNAGDGLRTALEVGELLISDLDGEGRVAPLDGHPVLRSISGAPVYAGGCKVEFTLSHNGSGKQTITLRRIELRVDFTPGADKALDYQVEAERLAGAGTARAREFSISLLGDEVAGARWIIDAKRGEFELARGANLLDVARLDADGNNLLVFDADNRNETLHGTILAQEEGLYEVSFKFAYAVGTEDRIHHRGPISIYCKA